MKYIFLFLFALQISFDLLAIENSEHFFEPVIKKLLQKNADTAFVYKLVNHKSVQFDEKFVKINVTGYLKKPDYSPHYNERAQNKSRKFLSDNLEILQSAEDKYGVPKEVITSVLWIETRHGGYLGYNHVVSVYLSTAMANEPEYIDMNKKNLKADFNGTAEELAELENKIEARANKKSNWAIDQLIALEKMEKISPVDIFELEGSWAGAFGMSQFLPESYINWAVDGDGDGSVNLFELEDAIFSVANYLKTNGWGETEEEQRKAVFHYNNSSAYVDAVLKLAKYIGYEMPEETNKSDSKSINTPLDVQID
jgi:membrane-bound lytic murein transglycosylase B